MSIRDAVNREIARDDVRREALGDIPYVPFNAETVMRFEGGDMTGLEIAGFFQSGIDSGIVWDLQGSYGRTAQALINAGVCHVAGE